MNTYLNLLFDYIHGNTMFLYTIIFIVSTLFAFLSQKDNNGTYEINLKWYIFSFLFLCFFYTFNDVGSDTPTYRLLFDFYKSFQDCSTTINSTGIELGYQYVNVILHIITSDSIIAVAIIRTLQLFIIYYALFLMRDKIHLGYAIMSYIVFFYFDSFNLLRSSLAGSLSLLSLVFLLKKKIIHAISLAVVMILIHKTSYIFLLSELLYVLVYKFRLVKSYKIFVILTIISFFIIIYWGGSIINSLIVEHDFGNGRYDHYLNQTSSFGLIVLIKYMPVIFILYTLFKPLRNLDEDWWNINFLFSIIGFSIALLGYQYGMLTRLFIYFSNSFLLLIPYYIKNGRILTKMDNSFTFKYSHKFVSFLLILFYGYMFVITIGGLYKVSGL